MATHSGPDISDGGLVLHIDVANQRGFRGLSVTNLSNQVTPSNYGPPTALLKIIPGQESVYIPALGDVFSTYVDIYNDFSGGSGQCCPLIYSFGSNLPVSSSTTYTFSIIYKSVNGSTNSNLMYIYQYTSGDAYVTEGGIHNTTNRISLGDDWWMAWNQLTTSATTAKLHFYAFHYQYATHNRFYFYRAALYAGSTVIPARFMPAPSETRGTTVASGGGASDLSGSSNHGELLNGVSYSSDNGGVFLFDGTNDYINAPCTKAATCTFSCWAKTTTFGNCPMLFNAGPSSVGPDLFFCAGIVSWNTWDGNANPFGNIPANANDGNWHNYVVVNDASSNTKLYYDGVLLGTAAYRSAAANTNLTIGGAVSEYIWNGSIAMFTVHNAALSASQIQQNFNALRGRFGV